MAGLLAMAIGAGGAALVMGGASAPVTTTDRAAIETIVREYILSHPEILPEAMRNLEAREISKVINARRSAIETPFAGAWEGAADGDLTLVEFFDYNCGYCRSAVADVRRLLAEDKKLRVVYREVPILGPQSETAARYSLAVAQQGGYSAFHASVFGAGRTTPSILNAAISAARADEAKVKATLESQAITDEIASNLDLQRALGMTGTPGWVVGNQVINGAVGYDELKAAIAKARAR